MSELNERGQRIAEALDHVPERWREAAMSWLEREGPERDGEVVALFKDRGLAPFWQKVDLGVERWHGSNLSFIAPNERYREQNWLRPLRFVPIAPNSFRREENRLRRLRFVPVAYRMIISDLLDPPRVADETRGELLERRRNMAGNLRRVAHDLKLDSAGNVSLAELLELSGWTPPAGDLPPSEPGTTRGSAVSALRDLASELERGRAITARDAMISGGMRRSDENANQREFEKSLYLRLRKVTGKPFDPFTAAAVAFVFGVPTDYTAVRNRRRARRPEKDR